MRSKHIYFLLKNIFDFFFGLVIDLVFHFADIQYICQKIIHLVFRGFFCDRVGFSFCNSMTELVFHFLFL